jgi:hypothetical protein
MFGEVGEHGRDDAGVYAGGGVIVEIDGSLHGFRL